MTTALVPEVHLADAATHEGRQSLALLEGRYLLWGGVVLAPCAVLNGAPGNRLRGCGPATRAAR